MKINGEVVDGLWLLVGVVILVLCVVLHDKTHVLGACMGELQYHRMGFEK